MGGSCVSRQRGLHHSALAAPLGGRISRVIRHFPSRAYDFQPPALAALPPVYPAWLRAWSIVYTAQKPLFQAVFRLVGSLLAYHLGAAVRDRRKASHYLRQKFQRKIEPMSEELPLFFRPRSQTAG